MPIMCESNCIDCNATRKQHTNCYTVKVPLDPSWQRNDLIKHLSYLSAYVQKFNTLKLMKLSTLASLHDYNFKILRVFWESHLLKFWDSYHFLPQF